MLPKYARAVLASRKESSLRHSDGPSGELIHMDRGSLAEAVVSLSAIGQNTQNLCAGMQANLMAIVKADGFGHGMIPVARTALAHGASWLGVTSAAEALTLRAAGITAPILSWMHRADTAYALLAESGVDISVSSLSQLHAVAGSRGANIHLKADTGLSRNGVMPDEWTELVTWARKYEAAGALRVRGIWSHLASPSLTQVAAFDEALACAYAAGLEPELRHLGDTAAARTMPEAHYDLVRVGIGLYDRAMTVQTEVINVKRVPAGTGVSYHHTHVTETATTLALVPLGYADGIPRSTSGRASVLVATGERLREPSGVRSGVRCPIVGRIAMDQFIVDTGDLPVEIGTPVVVFGPGNRGEPTVAEWADWADTIPHEILTGVGARVHRRYS